MTPEVLNGLFGSSTEVVRATVILVKELPVSTVYRLSIGYLDPAAAKHYPRTLFLKLSRPQTVVQASQDIGRAEVEFYQKAAPEMTCPPLIRCHDAGYCDDTGRSHILLEDLSESHSQPAEHHPPSPSMSRMAVETLAKVHAAWWHDPRLGNGIGEVFDDNWLQAFLVEVDTSVTRFLDLVKGELSPREIEAYRLLLRAAPPIWGRLTDRTGLTLTHGDAHWWNFLYPNDPETNAVHIFDWHLWHIDLGARDLAFLLAFGGFADLKMLPSSDRRGGGRRGRRGGRIFETDLLRHYHETLIENGITGYSWENLNEDYRWSAIRNLNLPVIFHSQGNPETIWRPALRHSLSAFERLKCAELITL